MQIKINSDWESISGETDGYTSLTIGSKGGISHEIIGHELGHVRCRDGSDRSPWERFLSECEAWASAIYRTPKGEYNPEIVVYCLGTYLPIVPDNKLLKAKEYIVCLANAC